MSTALKNEKEKSNPKEKNSKELLTADNKLFLIRHIENTYYAISDGKVIASGSVRKNVKEEAQQYESPKPLKRSANINIGLTSTIVLSNMLNNNQINIDEIKNYYYKNYNEDINLIEENLNKAIKQYCMAKYYDNTLQLEKSIYYKKFENIVLEKLNYNDFKNIMKFIMEPNLVSMEKTIYNKIKKELEEE